MPYEIGLIPDPDNPGCYVPLYDYYNRGYGLDDYVGTPRHGKEGVTLCPKLKQHYDMMCDAIAAREAGDTIEFKTQKDASIAYPELFKPSNDETTWVSIVDTSARIGVR